ncbi:MAG: M1 family metallopeptidase, partial [Hyphomicrobiaceae bacterium]
PQIDVRFYVVQLFLLVGLPATMLGMLAMFVHVVANSRYIGHLLTIGLVAGMSFMEYLGVENNLIKFADIPEVPLSDMNGLGHFLTGPLWFLAYWGFVSFLLGVAAHILWVRGPAMPLRSRVRGFRHAATRPVAAAGLAALVGTGLTGGFIYWNTRVLNAYRTQTDIEQRQVEYERTYRPLLGAVQPRVTEIDMAVDLRPETRSYSVRGRYVLANRSSQPIDTIYVQFDDELRVDRVELAGAAPPGRERCCNNYVFRTNVPLAPGETRVLDFALTMRNDGFRNGVHDSPIRDNGTFLHQARLGPSIGAHRGDFLQDERRRLAYGLSALSDIPADSDPLPYRRNYIAHDADFVRFAVTVSTSPDQIAVAPGYLQRDWSENGRRYFRYEMDRPILNFWSIVSARYAVAQDRWNDVDLSVHYHPPHALHVPRMIEAMKLALAYCSTEFGPFQYRQMRIVEFPYGQFAQSFPNTVPYSEKAGFIVDPKALRSFDFITFVTAHEVAHQWWAHQVVSADVPGATVLSETLAEYTALMIMEKQYGADRIRAFLKHDLDIYLRERGQGDRERPLIRVRSSGQPHIAYQKGGMAMYALKQAIGEAPINRALARFLRDYGLKSAPYPTADDLVRLLRAEAGPDHRQLVTDLFEKIVLWDYRATAATATRLPDGKWQVRLTVRARKLEADERGTETEVPLDQDVDVGLFAADPRGRAFSPQDVILLERRRLTSGTHTIELVAAQKPQFAGINPYLTFIQRTIEDTVAPVVH